jgi:16S rRNA (adenine1518-N6/adenine1519-N6)-dimethyltransferase
METTEPPSSSGCNGLAPVSHRPKRSLGQNFLVDGNLRRRIVEEARIAPEESVLEIGPGQGAITEGLSERVEAEGGRLFLVELDDELARDLAERYAGRADVDVIHASILDLPLTDLGVPPGLLKVVGNIPYNLTSPILFHLLRPPRPREILLMVQREVADRILADPGSRAYGALSVGVRTVARVERVLQVPASAFRPRPRVDSTVIRLLPLVPPLLSPEEEGRLRIFTRSLFQWRRKQLGKTLRDHPELGLEPEVVAEVLAAGGAVSTDRPERVSPEGILEMTRALERLGGGSARLLN